MKKTLFTLIILFFAVLGYSQGFPCSVTNNINSGSVEVDLYASPIGSCAVACVTTVCVYPGQTEIVNGCGPDFYEWTYAVVRPMTDDCDSPCVPGGVTVVSPTGCTAQFAFGFHCHANSNYFSLFTGPNTLLIQ